MRKSILAAAVYVVLSPAVLAGGPQFTDEFPLDGCRSTTAAGMVGTRYFQEVAPGVALDRAEHVAFDLEIQTSAGAFEDCIKVRETTPLEPGSESIKFYCPGIGLIADGDLVLQAIYDPERDRPAAETQ